jgi:hypothetical protein
MASAPDPIHSRTNALDVVVTLCLTYALCIVFIRLWKRRRLYRLEDVIAYFATVRSLQRTQGQLTVPNLRATFSSVFFHLSCGPRLQVLALGQFASQCVVQSNTSRSFRNHSPGEKAAETGSGQPPTANRPPLLFPEFAVPLRLYVRPVPGPTRCASCRMLTVDIPLRPFVPLSFGRSDCAPASYS